MFKLKSLHPPLQHFLPGGSLGEHPPETRNTSLSQQLLIVLPVPHQDQKLPGRLLMTPLGPCWVSGPLCCGCNQQCLPRTWDHSNPWGAKHGLRAGSGPLTGIMWPRDDFERNTSTAGPRYIRGCCLMLERRYGFRAGA